MINSILFYTFWIAFGLQMLYLVFIFLKAFLYKENTYVNQFDKPVSLIICARNEAKNIEQNLPSFLEQNYHDYEVIVVNDRSWDNTNGLLEKFQEWYPNLKIVTVPDNDLNTFAGKKLAKTLGIKAAKHEHLIFTDADCLPSSENWIYEVCKEFENGDLVISLSPYKGGEGFWSYLAKYDSLLIAYNYFAFALAKIPYMAVGRNMAFTKTLFFDVKGFKSHYTLPSGDDDLFVRDVIGKARICVSANEGGLTYSTPKTSFRTWIKQKKRHFLTAPKYAFSRKFFLGLYSISFLLLLVAFVFTIFLGEMNLYVLGALFLRTLMFTMFSYRVFKIMGETNKIFLIPFMELLLFLTNGLIYYSNKISKPTKWS